METIHTLRENIQEIDLQIQKIILTVVRDRQHIITKQEAHRDLSNPLVAKISEAIAGIRWKQSLYDAFLSHKITTLLDQRTILVQEVWKRKIKHQKDIYDPKQKQHCKATRSSLWDTSEEQEILAKVYECIHDHAVETQQRIQYQKLWTTNIPATTNPIAAYIKTLHETYGDFVDISTIIGTPTYTDQQEKNIIVERIQHARYPDKKQQDFIQAVKTYCQSAYNITDIDPHHITFVPWSRKWVMDTIQFSLPENGVLLSPSPGYPWRSQAAKQKNATIHHYDGLSGDDTLWQQAVCQAKNTKADAIILNFPNNPTWWAPSRKTLTKVLERCKKNNITIIADNAYAEVVYDDQYHYSIITRALQNDYIAKTIELHSASKDFSLAWIRAWYALWSPSLISRLKTSITIWSGPSTIDTWLYAHALQQSNDHETMRAYYRQRRDNAIAFFTSLWCEIIWWEPRGAFYLTCRIPPSYKHFTSFEKKIVEKYGFGLLPLSHVFDGDAQKLQWYFRVCYTGDLFKDKQSLFPQETWK